jgi:endonuclease-3
MATPNRAAAIKKTLRVIRKHYDPHVPAKDRTLLDHLLFACLLENSSHDAAERGFQALNKEFFDLNEVRVSTVRELSDSLRGLVDPAESADRLKRTLHSVFESVYAFDLEPLKKQNIGQAVKTVEKYDGTTPFIAAYVTQTALGGHAIPVNNGLLIALEVIGVISDVEAKKGFVPGLERAVPKSKGIEVASLMHQLGVEVGRNPYSPQVRKLLLEIEPGCKDRLPKRPVKKVEPEPPPPTPPKKKAASAKGETKGATPEPKAAPKKATKDKSPVKKKATDTPSKAAKKPTKPTKKVTKKKTTAKKKTASRRLSKKKPR